MMWSVVLLCLLAGARASPLQLLNEEWTAFKLQHDARYGSVAEEARAREAFENNRLAVARHNQRYALGLESYRTGLNKYSDLAPADFASRMNGFQPHARRQRPARPLRRGAAPAAGDLPGHKDWAAEGYVTSVKDQTSDCASCWAFAAAGALEGQVRRKGYKIEPLSAQNLVDCSTKFGNEGCKCGDTNRAFMYVYVNAGLDSEDTYPYEARDGPCRYDINGTYGWDDGFIDVNADNETALQITVAEVGPVAAAIDANGNFKDYKSGVYYNATCTTTVTHSVLVVGYGTDEREGDYWLIKNSWGTTWGEAGYGKMARNRDNNCGIASFASYPYLYDRMMTRHQTMINNN
ncbi:procathepsin L [Bicyclus anynana]|uniref:Procathepsin L n=1 Tax=Bicyclus anynana TaxID=110368 RepID=A0ABM3LPV9_BICAN|nr:procathepsin L [Bicyclus anynana]XP_052741118.1 procathepsin L [Bicyclus anynana]